jgi:hypothetical protein
MGTEEIKKSDDRGLRVYVGKLPPDIRKILQQIRADQEKKTGRPYSYTRAVLYLIRKNNCNK